jgi:hypothetical protein
VKRNDYGNDDHQVEDKNNNNFRFAEVRTKGPRGLVTHTNQSDERFQ